MPRPPKSLNAFPTYCDDVWSAVCDPNRFLPLSPPNDPAGYPNTQYLDFPNRRECETARNNLTKYRDAFGKIASSMPSSGKPGSAERQDAESRRRANTFIYEGMLLYTVSARNLNYPLERKFNTFYKLPDGPHRIYFVPRGADLQHRIQSQLPPIPSEAPSTAAQTHVGSTGISRALDEWAGIGSFRDKPKFVEEPLSDDELFSEE